MDNDVIIADANFRPTIVERHGGAISFDTSEAEGTTFHVDLPIDAA